MAGTKSDPLKMQPERERTDDSLRSERTNTDEALEIARQSTEQLADDVVARARKVADSVVDTARNKADRKLGTADAEPGSRQALAAERAVEDSILEGERAVADQSLENERRDKADALVNLLPLERRNTDAHLRTERVRADESLAHRDDFLGIVSHDLRNLLSNISIDVQSLQSAAQQDPEAGTSLKTVVRLARIGSGVERMDRLIGDLLDVVSLEAGELSLNLQPSDAVPLLHEAADYFKDAADNKGVSLECELSEPSIRASLDHNRMFQVVSNLIGNAIKFTEKGGSVRVAGARTGDALHITVADSGPGIREDFLPVIFERFTQAGKNDRRGHGLGLYISKRIVDAHGGRIWAESTGQGSSFHCTIPLTGTR